MNLTSLSNKFNKFMELSLTNLSNEFDNFLKKVSQIYQVI